MMAHRTFSSSTPPPDPTLKELDAGIDAYNRQLSKMNMQVEYGTNEPARNRVRVRYAPSPTGMMHIGGLRTFLYNYLFTKMHGGDMILRIEDTDKKREVEGSTEDIIRMLKWSGLEWDEGPGSLAHDMDNENQLKSMGPHGPYF